MSRGGTSKTFTDQQLEQFEQGKYSGLVKRLATELRAALATSNEQLAEIALLKEQLDGFRSTKIIRKRYSGLKCSHCGENGASHIGHYWGCLACGQTWNAAKKQEQEASQAGTSARTSAESVPW